MFGNPNTEGAKKNNFNWQKNMLLTQGDNATLLTAILAALGGSTTNAFFGPVRAAGAGTIPANSKSFSVFNAGLANGTFNGGVIKPGEAFSGASTAAVAYDGTGTELVITYIL